MTEHPQFCRVIPLLRPGCTPPSHEAIDGILLDKVHDQLTQDMRTSVSSKTATLIQDGWSNIHNEPIVASYLQVVNKSFLLESHDTGSMTKSGENCKALAQESIKMAKDKFDYVVTSVVTDNAKNMDKLRDGLKENDPSLVVYGCSAHMLNLLGQDITPSSVIKHVIEIRSISRTITNLMPG